jgi:hypothetical protein
MGKGVKHATTEHWFNGWTSECRGLHDHCPKQSAVWCSFSWYWILHNHRAVWLRDGASCNYVTGTRGGWAPTGHTHTHTARSCIYRKTVEFGLEVDRPGHKLCCGETFCFALGFYTIIIRGNTDLSPSSQVHASRICGISITVMCPRTGNTAQYLHGKGRIRIIASATSLKIRDNCMYHPNMKKHRVLLRFVLMYVFRGILTIKTYFSLNSVKCFVFTVSSDCFIWKVETNVFYVVYVNVSL